MKEVHFCVNHLVTKLVEPIGLVMESIFRKHFAQSGELGRKSRPFLIFQPVPTTVIKNHL